MEKSASQSSKTKFKPIEATKEKPKVSATSAWRQSIPGHGTRPSSAVKKPVAKAEQIKTPRPITAKPMTEAKSLTKKPLSKPEIK